ncbi:lipoate- ligase a protein [Rutstroemia sp. NJR-2017a BVV2]|nr:lipoate- ligase a protein [Rutstroemia sp. NJR-2017a BVV2]
MEGTVNKTQIYISRTHDPYINLSIEHYLLQKTAAESTVLFLYTNRPCIVIGRNQNPWLEVNLGLLRESPIGNIALVRRRSGGGTVFHDEGNVNYSVICPTPQFDRDKHADMVVRALHKLGVKQAIVNERHDIILRPETEEEETKPFKYLKSPAKPFIKGRGVDSVSSPVANVNVPNGAFEEAVVSEFADLYDDSQTPIILTDSVKDVPDIARGFHELTSLDWIYTQTPQFTFSIEQTAEDRRERPQLPEYLPPNFAASFTARNGTIIDANLQYTSNEKTHQLRDFLMNKRVHEIKWKDLTHEHPIGVAQWFGELFGDKVL